MRTVRERGNPTTAICREPLASACMTSEGCAPARGKTIALGRIAVHLSARALDVLLSRTTSAHDRNKVEFPGGAGPGIGGGRGMIREVESESVSSEVKPHRVLLYDDGSASNFLGAVVAEAGERPAFLAVQVDRYRSAFNNRRQMSCYPRPDRPGRDAGSRSGGENCSVRYGGGR